MKKQPEITDKTRTAFLDAFCVLYKHKPVEKITVQEVSNLAGYNRSTFYQYFLDIYNLLEYLEEDVMGRIKHFAKENGRSLNDAKGIPLADVDRIARLFEAEGEHLSVLFGKSMDNRFSMQLKEIMFPLMKNELGIPADNVEITYIQEFFLSGIISTFMRWYRYQDMPLKELADIVNKLVTGGVLPELSSLRENTQGK